MIRLRPYQEQALEAEAAHRREHPEETRLAIVMATGLGKTIIMAERARRFLDSFEGAGNRVLILTHTDELTSQAEAKVQLVVQPPTGPDEGYELPWSVGVVKADRDEVDADIVIGSVQTLLDPARRAQITDVGLVIVDECELYAAPQWLAVLRHYGCLPDCTCTPYCAGGDGPERDCPEHGEVAPTPLLGFTATLERSDGRGLGDIWQNVCFSRDISWGVRHGYLIQPVGYRLEIEPQDPVGSGQDGRFATTDQAIDDQMMQALAPERIVEKWLEVAKGRPTIAFMPLVRSAYALQGAFTLAGVSTRVVFGGMPSAERREALEAYQQGTVQVLVNAMVLTRGFDAPKTSCVIIGRPTKSRNLGIQMAGRGLRPDPLSPLPIEEQDCILIYVQDATTDLFTHADLSDRPVDRKAEGPLTVMEDQWDIGREMAAAERERLWTGGVSTKEFDLLAVRSSKVWRTTEHGTPFLPISKNGEYIFLVGTSVFVRLNTKGRYGPAVASRLHKDLPDLELAMTIAEDEAQDRGGDIGRLLADRDRAWRKAVPSEEMRSLALYLGLGPQLQRILNQKSSGKAGRLSDLITKVQATRALEPLVKRIKKRIDEEQQA